MLLYVHYQHYLLSFVQPLISKVLIIHLHFPRCQGLCVCVYVEKMRNIQRRCKCLWLCTDVCTECLCVSFAAYKKIWWPSLLHFKTTQNQIESEQLSIIRITLCHISPSFSSKSISLISCQRMQNSFSLKPGSTITICRTIISMSDIFKLPAVGQINHLYIWSENWISYMQINHSESRY